MCIVLLLNEILCRCLLNPFGLRCHLILKFLCWFFWSRYLSIGDSIVLKSPTIIVLRFICVLKYIGVYLMKSSVLTLGACKLTIDISSWCIVLFTSMKWPSLSFLTNLGLKSTLSCKYSYSCLFWGSFAWKIFLYPFTLSQCLFLWVRCVSCKQQIIGSSFLILLANSMSFDGGYETINIQC
jgi:hypothetical protein